MTSPTTYLQGQKVQFELELIGYVFWPFMDE